MYEGFRLTSTMRSYKQTTIQMFVNLEIIMLSLLKKKNIKSEQLKEHNLDNTSFSVHISIFEQRSKGITLSNTGTTMT
jgi:hypothetical protein